MRAWERTMGERMGALPGMYLLCEEHLSCDLRAALVDGINDHDGYLPPAFCIDAETGDEVRPEDVYAVVLPGADVAAALAEAQACMDRMHPPAPEHGADHYLRAAGIDPSSGER